MTTLTSTGNFFRRPNKSANIGFAIDYHFHNFDHTVIPLAGLWRVRQYHWVEGQTQPDPEMFIQEILIGSELFTPPNTDVAPWVLIKKNRWHSIELISKTIYGENDQTMEAKEGVFWCCFSHRNYLGEVVENDHGWPGTTL